MTKLTLDQIRQLPGIVSACTWKDRVYIDIRGNGGNYAGERNSKVWIDSNGGLHMDRGKGTTSREWEANLKTFSAAYAAAQEA